MYTAKLQGQGTWAVLLNGEVTTMSIVETASDMVLEGSNGSIPTAYFSVKMVLYYLNSFYK